MGVELKSAYSKKIKINIYIQTFFEISISNLIFFK